MFKIQQKFVDRDKDNIDELYDLCDKLLGDFGFPPDTYIIKKNIESVSIEFDDKGAVDYFRAQVEKEHPDEVFVEYLRKGIRHVAKVSFW